VSRPFRLKIVQQTAEAFLKKKGLLKLPVDPFEVAESLDIVVQGKPNDVAGVSGMLLRHGNSFGIIYATNIDSPGFQRFSVGHEIGHYMLEGHPEAVFTNGIHISRAGFVTDDVYELEADHFSAGLLMPETPFRNEIENHAPGLDAIKNVADICGTSLTATAIRYAETSHDAVGIVVSTNGVVDYCFLSSAMQELPQRAWVKKGSQIPIGSSAAALAASRERISAGERVTDMIDIRDWLGGPTVAEATEDSVGLGSYGKMLTVLTLPMTANQDEVEADDEETDEQVLDRWTPRFRR
jgi:Zn-dependent peptidase ImmA (M78 family)